ITDFVINVHHRPESVVGLVGTGSALGVHVAYSSETELMGTAGALIAARSLIGDQSFLVVYADNLFDIQLNRLLANHRASGATATMAIFERDDVSSSGVAILTRSGWISELHEKPRPNAIASHWVNAGLLVLEPEVYGLIPEHGPSDLSRDVMPLLAGRRHGLRGHPLGVDERVLWIDTMEDLAAAEAAIAPAMAAEL
ncbi:MAG: nucleotidyltransferase family protein, partial [Chloroflexota bacterium]|nr:nucleotidyltransferase family protein [Chloroflexota bacterium]